MNPIDTSRSNAVRAANILKHLEEFTDVRESVRVARKLLKEAFFLLEDWEEIDKK